MVKCPYCGKDIKGKFSKGPWKFRFYTVNRLECEQCGNPFNYYKGISNKGKPSEFTIRLNRSIKRT